MQLGFDPLISLPWLLAASLLYLLLLGTFYAGWRQWLSKSRWLTLLALKTFAFVVLLLLLLNPYLSHQKPDHSEVQLAVLIDATASMKEEDCDGSSRMQIVADKILRQTAPFYDKVLSKYENRQLYLFAGDKLIRLESGQAFSILSGDTDIDESLKKVLLKGKVKPGAALLITDGQDNLNLPLVSVAGIYRDAGVPVHIIGVGNSQEKPDIVVRWKQIPEKISKARPFRITAIVSRNTTGEQTFEVQLLDEDRLLQTKELRFAEGENSRTVEFMHSVYKAGFKTLKVKVEPLKEEINTINNVDYTGVQVRNPDEFKVLFFSANLDWDFKFLRLLAENQERLKLNAIIRLGEDNWFNYGFGEKPVDSFPELEKLNDYDCLIMSVNSMYLLAEKDLTNLKYFVEKRGGGVIFTGVTDELPKDLQAMLPVDLKTANKTRLGKE